MSQKATHIPKFHIKNRFQKRDELYEDILTDEILSDICERLFGVSDFEVNFDNESYNKGRLAVLTFKEKEYFISFSEINIEGRNSSFQSFPTALFAFLNSKASEKEICFYFHPDINGKYETEYFMILYRLMKTIGVNFLNEEMLSLKIKDYSNPEELINERKFMQAKNRRNKATYIDLSEEKIHIMGKVYGASKYESPLIALALSNISSRKIIFEQVPEGNLKLLPAPALEALRNKNITLLQSETTLQPESVLLDSKLREPGKYLMRLYQKFGDKKCAFCDCAISEEIQGAHILPVYILRKNVKEGKISIENAWEEAIDGENGLWLCKFHHHHFDQSLLKINNNGKLLYKETIKTERKIDIQNKTLYFSLDKEVLTEKFIYYLSQRNEYIEDSEYFEF